jgi:hypothetical protein
MLRRRPIMRVAATTAVVAGTAAVVGGGVNRRQAARAQAAAPPPEAAPPAAPVAEAPEDIYAQLSQLGALHEQGILTDEEFSAEKAKLLG